MKIFCRLLFSFSIAFCSVAYSEDGIVDDNLFYTDEDDELFNRGTFVGADDNAYLIAARRERTKNWAIAIGSTALGVATLILVGNNHNQ